MSKKDNTTSENQDLDFESAYQQLEKIVERMERGEQELESSLSDFEQGVTLMKHCHSLLKDAEQKVEILINENNGLFNTEPYNDQE